MHKYIPCKHLKLLLYVLRDNKKFILMCIDTLPVCDPKLKFYQVCPMMGRDLCASRRSAMKQKKRKFSYSKNKFVVLHRVPTK